MRYWDIGHAIGKRQEAEGWGTTVIDRLAVEFRSAFPDMRALSRTILKNKAADGEHLGVRCNWPTSCWPIAVR
ncbi:DUF1016 N-terminal domain-containing protein [Rhodococcus sp. IEGM 1318]|uniref:DUF1016 N-terminal domain-containing protein n=1 Tax=Rhodococcus sp. IEGM 1318 TaxID=3082226 RepID=UPI002954AEAD|nr:DUF1016 N-terminal domain-containing protein [Rhodococcus sp. IEGM 1318]MDV8009389.1 DUF1016 N-terminal domain-containing protein [Rhodococcus sp. IEGM 1318]